MMVSIVKFMWFWQMNACVQNDTDNGKLKYSEKKRFPLLLYPPQSVTELPEIEPRPPWCENYDQPTKHCHGPPPCIT